jgi:hypothetical protein
MTYAPTLTQAGIVDLESARGEILAEETIGQLAPKPTLPLIEVLPLERVHGLLVAAVVLSVAYEIPNQPTAQTSHPVARCTHLYWFKSGLLADASPPSVLVGVGSAVA